MMKWIIGLFIPSPAKLALMAASEIKKRINLLGHDEAVAKYSALALAVQDEVARSIEYVKDARIDDEEEKDIAARLEPLFKRLIDLATK